MVEAHDWSLRSHAQQATRSSLTTQADMRPESQRRKRSSFIKAKLMLRLSFFFFRKPSCARMQPPGNVSNLKPHEMRPEAPKRDHGTTRRQGPTGRSPRMEPQNEIFKRVQNRPRMWHFFRTSAAKPASPSLQLNITPGRFLEEVRTLSSPPKERHIRGPF